MADDTENETPDTPDADAQPETPEAESDAGAPAADAETGAGADASEADSDADVTADAAEAEAPAAPTADGEEPSAAPEEELSPKQRRRLRRSRHTGDVRPSRSPEERHAERQAERKGKAARRRVRRQQERIKAAERRAKAPAPEPLAPVHAPVEGRRRVRQGIVVSDKAEKTITVRIDVARRHRRYEKIVRSSTTLHAHDENNDAHIGDTVRVIESRPLSRTKRWALVDVLERAR